MRMRKRTTVEEKRRDLEYILYLWQQRHIAKKDEKKESETEDNKTPDNSKDKS
jgi:hypothetical protein